MQRALELAKQAGDVGEVPVGAVIVKDGVIVGEGRNRRENEHNALGHAEIEAINNACHTLKSWRLSDCEMYVTLEPCPMCAGAIINARLKSVYYGADDLKAGSVYSVISMFELPYNHTPNVKSGVLKEESLRLLQDFFKTIRNK
ncbi:MAG: nucleoside deaminase [Acutalibacteraceae bacterium]|nr:nucleoside deaminase [Acutalibacteraceae bacterium]